MDVLCWQPPPIDPSIGPSMSFSVDTPPFLDFWNYWKTQPIHQRLFSYWILGSTCICLKFWLAVSLFVRSGAMDATSMQSVRWNQRSRDGSDQEGETNITVFWPVEGNRRLVCLGGSWNKDAITRAKLLRAFMLFQQQRPTPSITQLTGRSNNEQPTTRANTSRHYSTLSQKQSFSFAISYIITPSANN